MSLIRKLEKRDYMGGYLTYGGEFSPFGPPNYVIPTNGQLSLIDGSSGGFVNGDAAMKHWAVWACVRIIADVVAGLPVDAYAPSGDEIDPLPPRLVDPSAYATMLEWLWQVVASLLLYGNAYGLISSIDRLGYPSQIDLITPEGVKIEKDDEGRKVFKIGSQTLTTDQVWHLPGPQLPGDLAGMSPIKYASRTIGLGLDAEKFGSDFFRNGINPTATLETDQPIDGGQAAEIKQRVKDATARRDLAVLGAGLHLNKWQLNAEESQFIETQLRNASAVAQVFGVPAEMIGAANSGRSVTYANREQRAQDFLQNAVNPWLARIERALSAWFPRGTYVKFNTGALLRSDMLVRYQAHEIGIRNGFELRSEARTIEDFPPVPGIDDQPLPTAGGAQSPSQPANQSPNQPPAQ